MMTKSVESSTKTKLLAKSRGGLGTNPATVANSKIAASKPSKTEIASTILADSKQNVLLALLRRNEGATIDELMRATAWQQHSVRGFLAGTVKKKMGLALTSSKVVGELRRYRIAARRGR